MQIEAGDGTIILKKIGNTLTVRDAERIAEIVESFAPFSNLVLDFTGVHECHDAAFLALVKMLQRLVGVAVVVRGLTRHKARLLKYLGLQATEVHAQG